MNLEKLSKWLYEASYNSDPKLLLQFVDYSTVTITKPLQPGFADLLRFGKREVRDYYFSVIDDQICCIAQMLNEHRTQLEADGEYY